MRAGRRARRWCTLFAALTAMASADPGAARGEESEPRRYAIIVGANRAPPARRDLRYAHGDAREVADILVRVGGYTPARVTVLLDPPPAQILAALDRALASETAGGDAMLVFYYSGHADTDKLYPNGQSLPLTELRKRLEDARIPVRVGIIDACRGGGWTGAKGLKPGPLFQVEWPPVLSNRGSVLIASSSGFEDAHESEALRGSFFTHHWNAGMRGAADQNSDGLITAREAFDYAQGLTIRDTAAVAETPQHPSFRVNLAGRRDITMVTLDRARVTLSLQQTKGPLQLVHLDTGLLLLESPRGRRDLRLSLRPGRYLIRRHAAGTMWTKEVELESASQVTLHEGELQPVPSGALVAKGLAERLVFRPTLPARAVELQLAVGVRHAPVIDPGLRVGEGGAGPVGILRLTVGLGRGWQVMAPLAVGYGTGGTQPWDAVVWAGAPVLGVGRTEAQGTIVSGLLGGGLDLRGRATTNTSFHASLSGLGSYRWTSHVPAPAAGAPSVPGSRNPDTWLVQITAGFGYQVSDAVSLNLGISGAHNLISRGDVAAFDFEQPGAGAVVAIGSVQRRGLRALPLVRIHLSDQLMLDGHVAVAYLPATNAVVETYLAGVTALWN